MCSDMLDFFNFLNQTTEKIKCAICILYKGHKATKKESKWWQEIVDDFATASKLYNKAVEEINITLIDIHNKENV